MNEGVCSDDSANAGVIEDTISSEATVSSTRTKKETVDVALPPRLLLKKRAISDEFQQRQVQLVEDDKREENVIKGTAAVPSSYQEYSTLLSGPGPASQDTRVLKNHNHNHHNNIHALEWSSASSVTSHSLIAEPFNRNSYYNRPVREPFEPQEDEDAIMGLVKLMLSTRGVAAAAQYTCTAPSSRSSHNSSGRRSRQSNRSISDGAYQSAAPVDTAVMEVTVDRDGDDSANAVLPAPAAPAVGISTVSSDFRAIESSRGVPAVHNISVAPMSALSAYALPGDCEALMQPEVAESDESTGPSHSKPRTRRESVYGRTGRKGRRGRRPLPSPSVRVTRRNSASTDYGGIVDDSSQGERYENKKVTAAASAKNDGDSEASSEDLVRQHQSVSPRRRPPLGTRELQGLGLQSLVDSTGKTASLNSKRRTATQVKPVSVPKPNQKTRFRGNNLIRRNAGSIEDGTVQVSMTLSEADDGIVEKFKRSRELSGLGVSPETARDLLASQVALAAMKGKSSSDSRSSTKSTRTSMAEQRRQKQQHEEAPRRTNRKSHMKKISAGHVDKLLARARTRVTSASEVKPKKRKLSELELLVASQVADEVRGPRQLRSMQAAGNRDVGRMNTRYPSKQAREKADENNNNNYNNNLNKNKVAVPTKRPADTQDKRGTRSAAARKRVGKQDEDNDDNCSSPQKRPRTSADKTIILTAVEKEIFCDRRGNLIDSITNNNNSSALSSKQSVQRRQAQEKSIWTHQTSRPSSSTSSSLAAISQQKPRIRAGKRLASATGSGNSMKRARTTASLSSPSSSSHDNIRSKPQPQPGAISNMGSEKRVRTFEKNIRVSVKSRSSGNGRTISIHKTADSSFVLPVRQSLRTALLASLQTETRVARHKVNSLKNSRDDEKSEEEVDSLPMANTIRKFNGGNNNVVVRATVSSSSSATRPATSSSSRAAASASTAPVLISNSSKQSIVAKGMDRVPVQWTELMDELLVEAHKKFDSLVRQLGTIESAWRKITDDLNKSTRSDRLHWTNVRAHWIIVIHPMLLKKQSLKRPWSTSEENRLLELSKQYRGIVTRHAMSRETNARQATTVSLLMGRSELTCREKVKQLLAAEGSKGGRGERDSTSPNAKRSRRSTVSISRDAASSDRRRGTVRRGTVTHTVSKVLHTGSFSLRRFKDDEEFIVSMRISWGSRRLGRSVSVCMHRAASETIRKRVTTKIKKTDG